MLGKKVSLGKINTELFKQNVMSLKVAYKDSTLKDPFIEGNFLFSLSFCVTRNRNF